MAKKKSERKSKTFTEALGLDNIINDKTGFVVGLILLCVAIFICIAFFSYFSTGQADQSLVVDMRPGEVQNSAREFQNYCGSIGALLSYGLISRCFGIPAFLIPAFIALCGVRMMGAYKKISLLKWFLGMALMMVWGSVTFAKFLTPLMGDQVFNPGGDHGAFCVQYMENLIGAPGLVSLLVIVMIAYLTYLTAETITIVRKLLNPVGYIRNKVKFTVVHDHFHGGTDNEQEDDEVMPNEALDDEEETIDPTLAEPIDLSTTASGVERLPDSFPDIKAPSAKKKTDKQDDKPGFDVEDTHKTEEAKGNTVANEELLLTPINPREPFTNWKSLHSTC